MALDAFAVGIHDGQGEGVGLVGFQEFSFRYAYAHIGAVRGEGDGLGGEALVTAGFFHAGDDEGRQHAGRVLGGGEFYLCVDASVGVQASLEQFLLIGLEGAGRSIETVFFKALEGGVTGFLEGDLGADGHVAGYAAAQPGCAHGDGEALAGF